MSDRETEKKAAVLGGRLAKVASGQDGTLSRGEAVNVKAEGVKAPLGLLTSDAVGEVKV